MWIYVGCFKPLVRMPFNLIIAHRIAVDLYSYCLSLGECMCVDSVLRWLNKTSECSLFMGIVETKRGKCVKWDVDCIKQRIDSFSIYCIKIINIIDSFYLTAYRHVIIMKFNQFFPSNPNVSRFAHNIPKFDRKQHFDAFTLFLSLVY